MNFLHLNPVIVLYRASRFVRHASRRACTVSKRKNLSLVIEASYGRFGVR